MGEAKFTPGPWVAVYRGDHGGGEEGDVHQKEKWDADPFDSGFMRGEFKWPDACLIAAAPELYEALKSCLNFMENTESELGFSLESADQARAALAKARGEA
ncbi:hypothetical protein HK16_09695 [Acetobacter senegalensis]|uniref:Uncharacterized protein n=2 Tax=Acetobacter TaxID=434 RepID=A0A252EMD8_9PROT|nr:MULTISPECIES: hypothetical protein [Acetobacter]ATJ90415.1 hypothetical protein CIW82_06675 [Acetobacter tropicalis]OUL67576.1 hypothetical protein HK16_09695 [Acetobacter senegalensis]